VARYCTTCECVPLYADARVVDELLVQPTSPTQRDDLASTHQRQRLCEACDPAAAATATTARPKADATAAATPRRRHGAVDDDEPAR
jgi:hypothetical protein